MKKKIRNITAGLTIDPKKLPKPIHNLLNGRRRLEFNKPKIKKTKDTISSE